MKKRPELIISLVANMLLFGALLGVVVHSKRESASSLSIPVRTSEEPSTLDPRRSSLDSVHESAQGALHWADIQTADYRVLLARLRAIGCPETTIRDIVAGHLNRQYNPQIIALRKGSSRFWETQQRRNKATFEEDMTREREARRLEGEKSRVMQDLLGVSFPDYLAEWTAKPGLHCDLMENIAQESRPHAWKSTQIRSIGT
jgi:hypothetical protein